MISVPQKFCDALKSLHREFIWNSKRAKIKHSSLIGEYRDGGLRDVDAEAKILSLKMSWIRKLKDSNFHSWKVLANHLLSEVEGETIFHANLSFSEKFGQRMNDPSLFYKELVLAWEKFSFCKNLTGSQISTQSLWNNKFIQSKSKSLYDDSLVSKVTMSASNLFDRKGELKNWETITKSKIQFRSSTLLKMVRSSQVYSKQLEKSSKKSQR